MRKWPIIPEFNEERRLIGGVISVRQIVYILFGFALAGGFVFMFWDINMLIGFIPALPVWGLALLMGFYEKDGVRFDRWIKEEIEYHLSQKTYILRDDD